MTSDLSTDLRPYSEENLGLLSKLLGDPGMTIYLGGPESPEKLQKRHRKFVEMSNEPSSGRVFVIVAGSERIPAGTIGYW